MVRYAPVAGPIHGVVDASPGWVSKRLESLAQQLLLPAPVRDAFLFDASPKFYRACTESIVTLQGAAKRIVEHLGLRCDTVICAFRTLPNPAHIQRVGNDWFMEISSDYKTDGYALGAILAHEVCHILLEEKRVPMFGTAVDEVHVDLAVMLSGLGALTLNAIETRSEVRGDTYYEQHRSFGYLKGPVMHHAYAEVCAGLGIGIRRATHRLRAYNARLGVRWQMLARLRRPHYAYRPLASHVIVPCGSVTCGKRLRMPTGKPGTAKCPECKATRDLDLRACRTRPLDAPLAIRDGQVPGKPHIFARLALAPAGAKIMLLLVLAVVGAFGFAKVREASRLGAIGDDCRANTECQSNQCLRERYGTGGTCTQSCTIDTDCPSPFRCRRALESEARFTLDTQVEHTVMVCTY